MLPANRPMYRMNIPWDIYPRHFDPLRCPGGGDMFSVVVTRVGNFTPNERGGKKTPAVGKLQDII